MARTVTRLAVLALVVLGACKHDPPAPAPAPSASAAVPAELQIDPSLLDQGRITTGAVEARGAGGAVTFPGTVEPAEAGSAEVTSLVAGRASVLSAKVGDAVTKGQGLVTVDSPEAGRAGADLLRARGRAVLAARALARQLELDAQEATSKAAVDQARAEDQAAKADLAAARTMLASIGAAEPAEGGGASTVIVLRSPIAGVVVERTAVLGGPVAPNTVLFRIVASDRVVVMARIPETAAQRPAPGDRVRIAPRRTSGVVALPCDGTVDKVVPWVDDSRTRAIRIDPAAACSFVPGAFVEVAVGDVVPQLDAGTKLWVPSSALVEVHGLTSVFVVGTKVGSFSLRPVKDRKSVV